MNLKRLEILTRTQKEQSLSEVKSLSNQMRLFDEKIADLKNVPDSQTPPVDPTEAIAHDLWANWLRDKILSTEAKKADIAAQLMIARQKAVRSIGRQNVVETLIKGHRLTISHLENRRNHN